MSTQRNTTNSGTVSNAIDLLTIAGQIATTAKALGEKIKTTGKPVILSANQLASKIPAIASLGDLPLFRARIAKNGLLEVDTIGLWVGETGEVGVYGSDLTYIPNAKILTWVAAIKGETIVEIDGVTLKTGFNASEACVEIIAKDGLNGAGLTGEGNPPTNLVSPIPQPEIPVYSDILPIDVVLEITKTGKTSRKFETPMVDAIDRATGEVFTNLICNADLQRIAETHGIGAKFKIVGKAPRLDREGNPIDATGKINRSKPAYVVKIADMQGDDFSNLTI
jgi:hypothetical protein